MNKMSLLNHLRNIDKELATMLYSDHDTIYTIDNLLSAECAYQCSVYEYLYGKTTRDVIREYAVSNFDKQFKWVRWAELGIDLSRKFWSTESVMDHADIINKSIRLQKGTVCYELVQ